MPEEEKKIKGQTPVEIEDHTIRKLFWRMGQRNDKKIAEGIYKEKKIDAIYNLEDSGLLDGFYQWLEEWKVIQILKSVSPSGVKRVMVPFFQFVLLYFLKTLSGIESMK